MVSMVVVTVLLGCHLKGSTTAEEREQYRVLQDKLAHAQQEANKLLTSLQNQFNSSPQSKEIENLNKMIMEEEKKLASKCGKDEKLSKDMNRPDEYLKCVKDSSVLTKKETK